MSMLPGPSIRQLIPGAQLADTAGHGITKLTETILPDAVTEPLGAVKDAAGVVLDVGQYFVHALVWLAQPKNWLRIALVIGGVALVWMGLATVARDAIKNNPAVKQAIVGVAGSKSGGAAIGAATKLGAA